MLLVIDNYDSFTYNLVQYFLELGEKVEVCRNDALTLKEIAKLKPARIVISPGPCTPNEAGISVPVIKEFAGKIPILGVCLGHQSIGQAFGGKIVRAAKVMHGKTSMIHHDNRTIFEKIENPFEATRYHSLVIEKESLPDCLEITAWTVASGNEEDLASPVRTNNGRGLGADGLSRTPAIEDEIMGVRHKEMLVEGIQFHPESILTREGKRILKNFLLC